MKIAKNLHQMLVGMAIAGMLFFSASSAFAYSQTRVTEGQKGSYRLKLPALSHQVQVYSAGYSAVRYNICTSDGTATGGISATFFSSDYPEGTDYPTFCPAGWKIQFTSPNNFTKYLDLTPATVDDSEQEGEEYYWIKFTNPEVIKGGESTWKSHSGSIHIPSKIELQVIIEDDD